MKFKKYHRIFLFLLLLAVAVGTSGKPQGRVSDSLLLSVEGMPEKDSVKMENYLHRAQEIIMQHPERRERDSAVTYAEKALEIASKYNHHRGKLRSYLALSESLLTDEEVLSYYFLALTELRWFDEPMIEASIWRKIGIAYKEAGLYQKGLDYLDRSRQIIDSLGSETDRMVLYEHIAACHRELEEYGEALRYYGDLRRYYNENGQVKEEINVLSEMVACHFGRGDYEEALEYNRQILEIYEDTQSLGGKIVALNNLGYNYRYMGQESEAARYLEEALQLTRAGGSEELAQPVRINLAIVYQRTGQTDQAIDLFNEAFNKAEAAGDREEAADIANLISRMYLSSGDPYNAITYNELAFRKAGLEFPRIRASLHLTASRIHNELFEYEEALEDFRSYLKINDSLLAIEREKQREYLNREYLAERLEREVSQSVARQEMEEQQRQMLKLENIRQEQRIELLEKTTELQEATIENQRLEQERLRQERVLAEERLAAEIKDRQILELQLLEQAQRDSLEKVEFARKEAIAQNKLLEKDNELQKEELARIRARNLFLVGLSLLALIILFLVWRMLRFARKTNRQLTEQRNKIRQQKEAIEDQYVIIEKEREKSDRLLLNILPEETATELKETGRSVPRSYEKVSVLFTDFVGFTRVAEKYSAEELVEELDYCFQAFDRIAEKYNLEKIKTIGDSYMAAGGIPAANDSNPEDTVAAGLEILEFLEKEREIRMKRGEDYWHIRIGINTGKVMAGVVGKKKFAYDIWGDAVNLASRMESSGEPGKVNISGPTYELVKEKFHCTHRGKVKAKNKGEIDMYFVDDRR